MYSLETIQELNERRVALKTNFNRDSSACQSSRGFVIHSGIHRSTAFIDATEHVECYASFAFWRRKGQAAINGFIESLIESGSLEQAESSALERCRKGWKIRPVYHKRRVIAWNASKFKRGFETRISAPTVQALHKLLK